MLDGLRGEAVDGELRRLARLPLVREALAWQNLLFSATASAIWSATLSSKRGVTNESCSTFSVTMRNESIGFFGPVAWGRFSDEGPPIQLRVGPSLVDLRMVTWEHWAMEVLAQRYGVVLELGEPLTLAGRMRAALAGVAPGAREAFDQLERMRQGLGASAGDAAAIEREMGEIGARVRAGHRRSTDASSRRETCRPHDRPRRLPAVGGSHRRPHRVASGRALFGLAARGAALGFARRRSYPAAALR